jgi:hypothetical protein
MRRWVPLRPPLARAQVQPLPPAPACTCVSEPRVPQCTIDRWCRLRQSERRARSEEPHRASAPTERPAVSANVRCDNHRREKYRLRHIWKTTLLKQRRYIADTRTQQMSCACRKQMRNWQHNFAIFGCYDYNDLNHNEPVRRHRSRRRRRADCRRGRGGPATCESSATRWFRD